MLAGGYSWRLFFYVVTAFGGALLVLAFFVVEESYYQRTLSVPLEPGTPVSEVTSKEGVTELESPPHVTLQRKSFASTLKPWEVFDHEAEFFMTILRSFTNFGIQAVFWVITTYGVLPCSTTSLELIKARDVHRAGCTLLELCEYFYLLMAL